MIAPHSRPGDARCGQVLPASTEGAATDAPAPSPVKSWKPSRPRPHAQPEPGGDGVSRDPATPKGPDAAPQVERWSQSGSQGRCNGVELAEGMFLRDYRVQRAIVTGGSSGIGQASAIALAQMGCDIGITHYDDPRGANATREAVEALGQRFFSVDADFRDMPHAAESIDHLADQLGGVDAFVANAGVNSKTLFLEATPEELRRVTSINLDGTFLTVQRAARRMVDQGCGGRIIVITSVHEHDAMPGGIVYGMTKHALGGMVKTLALELSHHRILVNAVAPGEIATRINNMTDADVAKQARPVIPAGRPGYASEVAGVVRFLASPEGGFVTGSSYRVDGGFGVMTPLASTLYRDYAEDLSA